MARSESAPFLSRSGGLFIFAKPVAGDASTFEGIIRLPGSDRDERIRVVRLSEKPGQFAFFTSSHELSALFRQDGHRQRLSQCQTPANFFTEVKHICERATLLSSSRSSLQPLASRLFKTLFESLGQIGMHHVISIDIPNLRLSLALFDASTRRHELHICLPSEFPDQPPSEYQIALPISGTTSSMRTRQVPRSKDHDAIIVNDERTELVLMPEAQLALRGARDLRQIYEIFQGELGHYQRFWDVMDDLDRELWVLEPATPSRSTTYRRIGVLPHCSLHIVVDPVAPYSIPDLRVLGAEARTASLRQQVTSALPSWNYDASPRANLETVLGMPLPSKRTSSRKDVESDCGICYAHRLDEDNSLPICACDNDKCTAVFHRSCLLEWLRSVPTTHTSYATTYGQCPYCSDSIHV